MKITKKIFEKIISSSDLELVGIATCTDTGSVSCCYETGDISVFTHADYCGYSTVNMLIGHHPVTISDHAEEMDCFAFSLSRLSKKRVITASDLKKHIDNCDRFSVRKYTSVSGSDSIDVVCGHTSITLAKKGAVKIDKISIRGVVFDLVKDDGTMYAMTESYEIVRKIVMGAISWES